MGNERTAPSTPSFTTIHSTLTTNAAPATPHHATTKNVTTNVVSALNNNNPVQTTPSNFHHTVLSDANSRNLR